MRYIEKEKAWLVPPSNGQALEILVSGDSSSPDGEQLVFSNTVLPLLALASAKATALLDQFVDRSRFATGSEWELVGIRFGGPLGMPKDHYKLLFSIKDDLYGEWSVTMSHYKAMPFPIDFGRRQI